MRDYTSKSAWSEYRAIKKKGFPYNGTAALKLNDGYRGGKDMLDNSAVWAYGPYWIALELVKEGKESELKKPVTDILAKCKENHKRDLEYRRNFESTPDTYKGFPLNWKCFRPSDTRFNDPGYGHETQICTLPFRASEGDKKALRELIYTPFVDPYCDGRDCTGAMFTGGIDIYTTDSKTVILHRIYYDV